MSIRQFIVLPVEGRPYITHPNRVFTKKNDMLSILQEEVGGDIQQYAASDFVIHPMFVTANPRWALAQRLLRLSKTKVWVNENGANRCSVNMGTVITTKYMRVGGCPHLWGNIVLEVMISDLKKAKISTELLREKDQYPYSEEEDDEEADSD